MGIALLFIDGVGIGENNPALNPLARERFLLSQFQNGDGTSLPPGGECRHLETTFGVPGRPQSATNQTALFTGLPVPRLLGQHLLGFPNGPLREYLKEYSIVKRLKAHGLSSEFVNVYPAAYLDVVGLARRPSAQGDLDIPYKMARKLKASASTLAMAAGNFQFRTLEDARLGLGLTHDIVGDIARRRGFQVPPRSPEEAATIFWNLAQGQALTVFEHYQADEAGHAQDFDAALKSLAAFDAFARAVIKKRPNGDQVLIISDHGNVENLSHRQHTLNPVPLLTFGVDQKMLLPLHTVADVGTLVLRLSEVRP